MPITTSQGPVAPSIKLFCTARAVFPCVFVGPGMSFFRDFLGSAGVSVSSCIMRFHSVGCQFGCQFREPLTGGHGGQTRLSLRPWDDAAILAKVNACLVFRLFISPASSGRLPKVNCTPPRSSASLITPIVLNEVWRRSSSQSAMVVIPNPASLAKSARDHPNNVLAARTCLGVIECPVIET
jgi:hypothetical protein